MCSIHRLDERSSDLLAAELARVVRRTRRARRITQAQLGEAVGVTQAAISQIERRRRPGVSLRLVGDICDALDIRAELRLRPPFLAGAWAKTDSATGRQRDAGHARCSAYVRRHLERAGWVAEQEVEVRHGRSHGFIDILAFHPPTGTLQVDEIKTTISDVGRTQRTIAWYEAQAVETAGRLGWRATRAFSCLFVLATDENDDLIETNRELFAQWFPARARRLARVIAEPDPTVVGLRGLAMIDPLGRRRSWLIPSRADKRPGDAPYRDHADLLERLAASRKSHARNEQGSELPVMPSGEGLGEPRTNRRR
jgi:transcriptional regulator with XRE-family HTH domain